MQQSISKKWKGIMINRWRCISMKWMLLSQLKIRFQILLIIYIFNYSKKTSLRLSPFLFLVRISLMPVNRIDTCKVSTLWVSTSYTELKIINQGIYYANFMNARPCASKLLETFATVGSSTLVSTPHLTTYELCSCICCAWAKFNLPLTMPQIRPVI